MRVAILGAGGVALATAAMVHQQGHVPVLWSPSGAGTLALRDADLQATGALEARFRPAVADGVEAAIRGADVIIVALPATGHRKVFDLALPHLSSDQTVIVSAQLSFGALYLAQSLQTHGVEATIVALSTTVLLGRRTAPTEVSIGGIRKALEAAVIPADRGGQALDVCNALFGQRFRLARSLIQISLSNLNPPVHMANSLCNLTRIERAEPWFNYDGITPAVARLILALDRERLAVAAAYRVTVRTVEEHFRISFDLPDGMSLAEMAAAVHRQRNGPPGPTALDTRFVTEDVPFGIVQVIALARQASVPVPLHEAGLQFFDALYGRTFTAENDLLPLIDLADPLMSG